MKGIPVFSPDDVVLLDGRRISSSAPGEDVPGNSAGECRWRDTHWLASPDRSDPAEHDGRDDSTFPSVTMKNRSGMPAFPTPKQHYHTSRTQPCKDNLHCRAENRSSQTNGSLRGGPPPGWNLEATHRGNVEPPRFCPGFSRISPAQRRCNLL